ELADRVDALALQAVVRAYGQVQLLDRQRQIGGELRVLRRRADIDALRLLVQLARETEQLDKRRTGGRERGARRDRRLRLDVDDQPVEVGALLDTGGLDAVRHLQHWRVDRVHRNAADFRLAVLVLRSGHVAAATLNGQLHVDPSLAVEGRELQIGVVHIDAGRRLDVARG